MPSSTNYLTLNEEKPVETGQLAINTEKSLQGPQRSTSDEVPNETSFKTDDAPMFQPMFQRLRIATKRGLNRAKKLSKLQANNRLAPSPWRRGVQRFWKKKTEDILQITRQQSPKRQQQTPKTLSLKEVQLLKKPESMNNLIVQQAAKTDCNENNKIVRQHTILWHMCDSSQVRSPHSKNCSPHPPQTYPRSTRHLKRQPFNSALVPVMENVELSPRRMAAKRLLDPMKQRKTLKMPSIQCRSPLNRSKCQKEILPSLVL